MNILESFYPISRNNITLKNMMFKNSGYKYKLFSISNANKKYFFETSHHVCTNRKQREETPNFCFLLQFCHINNVTIFIPFTAENILVSSNFAFHCNSFIAFFVMKNPLKRRKEFLHKSQMSSRYSTIHLILSFKIH